MAHAQSGKRINLNTFGGLLRHYRHRCIDWERNSRLLSQERLGELIGQKLGISGYSGAAISDWERNKSHINKDERRVLLSLIEVMHTGGGIKSLDEANQLLLAGNYRDLNQAELQLIDKEWLNQKTAESNQYSYSTAEEQEALLPPATYTRLFGIEEKKAIICQHLLSSNPPYVVIITGIGGIGKSTIADTVARQLIQTRHFAQVIWLSTNTSNDQTSEANSSSTFANLVTKLGERLLPNTLERESVERQLFQVRRELKKRPNLIILDNLEGDISLHFWENLRRLTNPSKFLLTSRIYPPDTSDFYLLNLSELPLKSSIGLLRHQALIVGSTELSHLTDQNLTDIYNIVGGNPFALRLVAKLAIIYSLPQIQASLKRGQTGAIAQMYMDIYHEVWQTLQQTEKQLLQTMLLVGYTGALVEQLQIISKLDEDNFEQALHQLINYSLIEPRGNIYTQRYGIHSLTAQYLQNQKETSDMTFTESNLVNLKYWHEYLAIDS